MTSIGRSRTNEQAVASTPDDHPDRAMYLNNLGIALQSRFERTGSMDDLDRAITTNEQAVASTPDDHPNRAMYLNNLGNALQRRFERTGSMDDLDRAITTNEQAVASTPDDHPNRGNVPQQLGERAAEPIRADGIDGRPRSGDHDERAGGRIHPG